MVVRERIFEVYRPLGRATWYCFCRLLRLGAQAALHAHLAVRFIPKAKLKAGRVRAASLYLEKEMGCVPILKIQV